MGENPGLTPHAIVTDEPVIFYNHVGICRGTTSDYRAIVDLYRVNVPSADDFEGLGYLEYQDRAEAIAIRHKDTTAQLLGRKHIDMNYRYLLRRLDDARRDKPDLEYGAPVLVLAKEYFGVVGNVVAEGDEYWTIVTSSNQVNHLSSDDPEYPLTWPIAESAAMFFVRLDGVVPYDPEWRPNW